MVADEGRGQPWNRVGLLYVSKDYPSSCAQGGLKPTSLLFQGLSKTLEKLPEFFSIQ